ncbi:hypothetical protein B0H11DRAFT_1993809 [Mycena galericulata]|nr:hypothetical protein B0H11DRAFT_1993809 [Mycena galericulata]
MGPHPLDIQELVDHTIGYLDQYPDLTACALVSRSWVDAAQVQLFREIHLDLDWSSANESRWSLLYATLTLSPRLIRYIQRLYIKPSRMHAGVFSAICVFPFAHLLDVFVSSERDIVMSDAMSLQSLFSLPTLRRIGLTGEFMDPAVFLNIWARCSRSVRHLNLQALQRVYDEFGTIPPLEEFPIPLKSLRIEYTECVEDWLVHDHCCFDLSRLKLLSLHSNIHLLRSPAFQRAFESIEALDFQIVDFNITKAVDLSAFPNLSVLRITCRAPNPLPLILPVFSTIAPTNRIHTIALVASFSEIELRELDAALSGLAGPVVELTVDAERYSYAASFLPLLRATDRLRRVDYNARWFDVRPLSICIVLCTIETERIAKELLRRAGFVNDEAHTPCVYVPLLRVSWISRLRFQIISKLNLNFDWL